MFGKLVIILTEAARHVHHFQGTIWIGNIGDVVISPVEGRPHEVGCRGIHANIAAIGILDVEDLGDQVAMWRQHEAAQFGIDLHIAQTIWHQNRIELGMDTGPNEGNIILLVFRAVVYSNAP